MKTNKLIRVFEIPLFIGIVASISFLLLIFSPRTFVSSALTGFLFGFSLCFLLFLLLVCLYYRTEKFEKDKLLLKVKSSPLDTTAKKWKNYKVILIYFIFIFIILLYNFVVYCYS